MDNPVLSQCRRAVSEEPANPLRQLELARAALQAGQVAEAAAAAKKAEKSSTHRLPARLILGRTLLIGGDFHAAEKIAEELLEQRADAEAHNLRGEARGNLGRAREATEDFRAAATLDPEQTAYPFNLAIALQLQGDNKAAIESYSRVLEIDPANQPAMNKGAAGAETPSQGSEPAVSVSTEEELVNALATLTASESKIEAARWVLKRWGAFRKETVTLNPRAHLDPAGTVLLLLVGFGWGKPVPVNPNVASNPKAAMAIIAGAGPLSNFLVAFVAGLPVQAGLVPWLPPFNLTAIDRQLFFGFDAADYLGLYLSAIVVISIILGVFNLLPIFPLDGHRVIPAFLTDQAAHSYMQFQGRYGFLILIVLIALPFLTGGQFGILFEVMSPVINLLSHLFAGNGDVFGFG